MRRITVVGLASAVAATLSVLAPVAANAASGSTNVTFTLTGGSLTISAPSSATLTSGGGSLTLGLSGQTVSANLGNTTVTDAQGALGHVDTVTMAASDFTDAATDTISKSNATAYVASVTPTGSLSAATPSSTAATPSQIGNSGGASILTMTGIVGTASATYNPTVTVSIPSNAVAGTYSGTITQTVS